MKRSPIQEMTWRLNEIETVSDLRSYNGLSAIGEKCLRKLQLGHYNIYTTSNSARILRLFNEGHRMEPVLREALKNALGILSYDDQAQVVGIAGHWKGHIDGKGVFLKDSEFFEDGEFLTEFKTHNDKSFKDVKKKGVKESKPMHFDQMTSYMGHNELPKCLYVAYNKNDSEIYIEWVELDKERFKELQRKEAEVIMADSLLDRIGNDQPTWFECKMCDARKVCFAKEPIKQNCKNCQFVDVLDDGKWSCQKGIFTLADDIGEEKCDNYQKGEMFWELI